MAGPVFQTHAVGHGQLSKLCPIPTDKIVSTVLVSTDTTKQVVFCLPEGQALSDHQTPNVATIHLLDGAASVGVAGESIELESGGIVVIPPRVTHSVTATRPTRILLSLVKETNQ